MSSQIKSLHRLRFSIGGYNTTKYEVELNGTTLSYNTYDYFPEREPHTRQISDQELKQLIEALNKSELPNWSFAESDVLVHDGTQWELFIQYNGNLRKKIYGSNEYPNPLPGQDSMGHTPAFRSFLKGITRLVPEFDLGK